jgi:hypothetical protein
MQVKVSTKMDSNKQNYFLKKKNFWKELNQKQ